MNFSSRIMLAFLCPWSGCVVDQRCEADENCPDEKVCVANLCVVGEGEGEPSDGEGEPNEGEGEPGEGEPGIIPNPCGDGTRDETIGEECDDGDRDGGDGCSAGCKSESERCNVAVPSDFPIDGAIAGDGVDDNPALGCYVSIGSAISGLVSQPNIPLYIAPGTYENEDWPLTFNRRVVGAGVGQVDIGDPGPVSPEGAVTTRINADASVEHLTLRGDFRNVVLIDIGESRVSVVFHDVVFQGDDTLLQSLIFTNGGADSVSIGHSTLSQGGIFFGASSTATSLVVENTDFQSADMSIFGANSVSVSNSSFFLVQNNIMAIDPGSDTPVTFDGNTFDGDPCSAGETEDKRPLSLQDGEHVLSNNSFRGRANCTSVRVDVPDGSGQTVKLTNNTFAQGSRLDLDVLSNIRIEDATTNTWSNDQNPCSVIAVASANSVVEPVAGTFCPAP
jgi:cysteine-rich repeat protein